MQLAGDVIKLVIWDLDGTLWSGNLAEEGTAKLDSRNELVRELAYRGVISTICSKNHLEEAKAILEAAGLWDYFVFPKVSFFPKGAAIRQTLEEMGLRAPNVLFLDDEVSNRREAERDCPGIKTGTFEEYESLLRNFVEEVSRTDAVLARLSSYRGIERKTRERKISIVSNEEFLRESQIKISINREIDSRIDRVFELLNRTNQLNFTKRRAHTEEEQGVLREEFNHFQSSLGIVSCSDKFCDYGEVGFFQVMSSRNGRRLVHFAFSCRILNMGVEAFLYRMLGEPRLKVREPVAYPVETYRGCDWIEVSDDASEGFVGAALGRGETVLLGPCNLLQVSNYLSQPKSEFVHYERKGVPIKFDCPGFLLSDPAKVAASEALEGANTWTKEEFVRFRNSLKSAECVILDLGDLLHVHRLVEVDGISFRCDGRSFEEDSPYSVRFCKMEERAGWVREAVLAVADETPENCRILVLNRLVHPGLLQAQLAHRLGCEVCLRSAANECGKAELVDLNYFSRFGIHSDGIHLSRQGYHELAKSIVRDDLPRKDLEYELFSILGQTSVKNAVTDPDVLREIALQFEREGDIELALRVMERALRLRPYGEVLKEKIREYRESLAKAGRP